MPTGSYAAHDPARCRECAFEHWLTYLSRSSM